MILVGLLVYCITVLIADGFWSSINDDRDEPFGHGTVFVAALLWPVAVLFCIGGWLAKLVGGKDA